MKSASVLVVLAVLSIRLATAGEIAFAQKPSAVKAGDGAKISFAVSAPTDVEVAIANASNAVVRHLAAGVLGGDNPPPEPLKPGLSQELTWDGKDDFGKPAVGGPFKARVRLGTGVTFGRFIGGDPCQFGRIDDVASDEDGNVFVMGFDDDIGRTIRVFGPDGRYLRTVMPFPANLKPEAMGEIADWDAGNKAFIPRNTRDLGPEFYIRGGGRLNLVAVQKKTGVVLADDVKLYHLTPQGAAFDDHFAGQWLWETRGVKRAGGTTLLAVSPDGKFIYLGGTCKMVAPVNNKPIRLCRMALGTEETMKAFVTGEGGSAPFGHVAVDAKGRVYAADPKGNRVAVFDDDGKELGSLPVTAPGPIAVHPKTGALYVLGKALTRFDRFETDAKPAATFELGPAGAGPALAVSAAGDRTVIWIAGPRGEIVTVEDTGKALQPAKTAWGPVPGAQSHFNRIATDPGFDDVYVNDGWAQIWRYNGLTGEGALLPVRGTDLAVGYDGLLYYRTGTGYSGPFERFTRDLKPAPYPSGTHVLSSYIYSRMKIGFAERGIGPAPDGKVYISFMHDWAKYCMAGFDAEGKPMKGKYLEGKVGNRGNPKTGYPPDLNSAIMGPIPEANCGIRVDLRGNIYMGVCHLPTGFKSPPGFDSMIWKHMVGSVLKFPPEGGVFEKDGIQGLRACYPGLGPFSHAGLTSNPCCVCRGPRFDLDRYGRLVMPNAVKNSVQIVDNAGNLIVEFGQYGNYDSQFIPPGSKDNKPLVDVPAIPLAWPTGAGFGQQSVYISDTYNHRIVRVDLTWKADEQCEVK